ncbi:Valacyclovir hydrolase [Frankliniella fusca]|uniref:Valacyclovir hydrolase n=1 Tax=Frankliniella fusca TaxID=407009 RepID=A0AAE1LS08_9NEOP|nr:Valacyclovir hydrolase [Frankliniella fusca]
MSLYCRSGLSKYAGSLKSGWNSPIALLHSRDRGAVPNSGSGAAAMEGGKEIIDGVGISYIRSGSGPHPVLCLPGALGSAWTDFKPQLELLSQKEFTIIAWDPPGYGHSRPPNRDFIGQFLHRDADFALKLMKALKLPKFSMLGWSDGGITAMILAAKYPLHIKKCAVWGANAFILQEEIETYRKMRDIDTWSEKMKAPLIELYGLEYFRTTWENWVDAFDRIYKVDDADICRKEVKLIQCPLLVLHGDKDPMVSGQHPKYLLSEVHNCRTYNFPFGKHNIHLRYPEEFNQVVSEFLLKYVPGGQYQRIQGEPL